MPVNLSIKNAPGDLVAALKLRAQRNHRSMQREALAILEAAVQKPPPRTIDDVLTEVRRLGLKSSSESAAIVRKMRDERYGR